MKCPNCNKEASLTISCRNCILLFCSTNCKINHFFNTHKEANKGKELQIKTPSTKSIQQFASSFSSPSPSPFMIEGKILNTLGYDKMYSLENLDQVFLKNKPVAIGSGTFSNVFLYKNKLDSRFYAVKHMSKKKINEICGNLDIIYKEIEIHSKLMHENIIRLYHVRETPNSFDLVLEYAKGGTLFNSISKNKGMDEDKAFPFFIQTCAAINFLHVNDLLHRDIKPENLLIDENGKVKLCDFGWCKEIEIGKRLTFCGTIEYMAPEIIKEEPYDKSIDVWALGVLLYEIIHGYSPFRSTKPNSDSNMETFKNILSNNLNFDKTVSQECKDLIMKMIEPNNNKRIKIEEVFQMPFVRKYEQSYSSSLKNNEQTTTVSTIKSHNDKKGESSKIDKVMLEFNKETKDKEKGNYNTKPYNNMSNIIANNSNALEKSKININSNNTNINININHDKPQQDLQLIPKQEETTSNTNNKNINQNNELYFSVLDQVSKKNKTKKGNNSDLRSKKKRTNDSHEISRRDKINDESTDKPNKSNGASKLGSYVNEEDNVNDEIYLNRVTRESAKAKQKTRFSVKNSSSFNGEKYDITKEALLDATNLIDLTSGVDFNDINKPKKSDTLWDKFIKPFQCD